MQECGRNWKVRCKKGQEICVVRTLSDDVDSKSQRLKLNNDEQTTGVAEREVMCLS